MRLIYYKLRQVLQSAVIITNCDSTNHCFQFLLGNMGIIAVSREIEDNGYAVSFFSGGGGG